MVPKCGTDMEFEDFRSGGDVVVPGRILPSASEKGIEVPVTRSFGELVDILKRKASQEIVDILASKEASELYGNPEATIRNVASDIEESDVELAYRLHSANWEAFRDADSLGRMVDLAIRTGRRADAFKYARIAQYVGGGANPFRLIAAVDYDTGSAFVESVLADAIVSNPNRIPYLSDKETWRFLEGSRKADEKALKSLDPESREAWETKLRGLEFRALTLLDPVNLRTYVSILWEIASGKAEIEGGSESFLAEYACSAPSAVAEAHYASITGGESVVAHDRASVAETLYRRFAYVADHFIDYRFAPIFEELKALFDALDAPYQSYAFQKTLENLAKQREFYEKLPSTVLDFRNRLLAELSSAYGSAYYPRAKAWVFARKQKLKIPNQGIAALLLVDALSHEEEMTQDVLDMAEELAKLPVIPEVASFVAFAFAAKDEYDAAANWLARSNLDDPENSALLLRIVAQFRELSPTAIEAFRFGAPIARPSAEHALSRIRSIVAEYDPPLANEMLWDGEAGFWDPVKALGYYAEAYRLWNFAALKKLADLEYGLWRFDEAVDHYQALSLDERHAAEVAPKLCLHACEKGDMARAAAEYAKVDVSSPENFATIASYRAYEGDYFAGLCEMSPHPWAMSVDLSPEMRHSYETYAEALCEKVAADGALLKLPEPDVLPSELVGLRSLALTFCKWPEAALRYFRYLSDAVLLSEDTERQEEIDVTVIWALAPCHDEGALGFATYGEDAKDDREQSLIDLVSIEARLLAEEYRFCATNPETRWKYSELLFRMSEFFASQDIELSAFFREAGALAVWGVEFDPEAEGAPSSAVLH